MAESQKMPPLTTLIGLIGLITCYAGGRKEGEEEEEEEEGGGDTPPARPEFSEKYDVSIEGRNKQGEQVASGRQDVGWRIT